MSEIKDLGGPDGQPAGGADAPEPVSAVSAKGAHQAQGHTPTPWRVGRAVNGNWIEAGHACQPVSIGRTFYEQVGSQTEDANAAFIVRAVNSHDALVSALTGLSAVAEMTTFSDQYPAECEAALVALAAASSEVSA